MKEVTKIHLGRQQFTIAVDAYKDMQDYLRAIERQVGKQSADVLEEIELRMAELLNERGISGDKVVLPKDVEYLKQQLGKPGDFKDDAEARDAYEEPENTGGNQKRLYRDTEDVWLAGVSSGIAAYFGIDPLIVRILFIVAVISGGWGILLYLLLWIFVPEAKTPSERLQMRGEAVTVDNIKQAVERADVKGAAERAGQRAGKVVQTVLKGVAAVMGVILVTIGSTILFGGLALGTFLLAHGTQVNNQVVFPTNGQEWLLAGCILAMGAVMGLLLLLGGMALIRRRSILPVWVTVTLVTLFFASASVGLAMAQDIQPTLEKRIDAAQAMYMEQPCETSIFNYCDIYRKEPSQTQP